MNKAQLVAALADRLGDRSSAAQAVDDLLDVIVRAVHAGDSVTITGFGVFERRERAARTARNPRTGLAMQLAATNVPAFRAGATFRDVVSGARALPAQRPTGAPAATPPVAAASGRTPAAKPATRPAAPARTAAPAAPTSVAPQRLDPGKQRDGKAVSKGADSGKPKPDGKAVSKGADSGKPKPGGKDSKDAKGPGKDGKRASQSADKDSKGGKAKGSAKNGAKSKGGKKKK